MSKVQGQFLMSEVALYLELRARLVGLSRDERVREGRERRHGTCGRGLVPRQPVRRACSRRLDVHRWLPFGGGIVRL